MHWRSATSCPRNTRRRHHGRCPRPNSFAACSSSSASSPSSRRCICSPTCCSWSSARCWSPSPCAPSRRPIARGTTLGQRLSLLAAGLGVLALLGGIAYVFGAQISDQLVALFDKLPAAADAASQRVPFLAMPVSELVKGSSIGDLLAGALSWGKAVAGSIATVVLDRHRRHLHRHQSRHLSARTRHAVPQARAAANRRHAERRRRGAAPVARRAAPRHDHGRRDDRRAGSPSSACRRRWAWASSPACSSSSLI